MLDPTLLAAGSGAVVLLLAVSAFFSSSEIAMFSVSPEWVRERANAGDERAVSLDALRSDPHRLLVTILVGNNVVNVAISSIVTVLVAQSFSGGVAITLATVIASALVLICGEIVPKSYGLGNAEEWSLRMVGPLAVVETLLSPLVTVFDVLTRYIGGLLGGDEHIEEPYTDD
jgi:Mg2+/Co2+ transporter CorB